MRPYLHRVQSYETDRMGITHHSNYIRWMEEARVDFLEQLCWGYDRLESLGVASPVLGVECGPARPAAPQPAGVRRAALLFGGRGAERLSPAAAAGERKAAESRAAGHERSPRVQRG